jgi:CubicO group peptidase (beta-lactamase class C family)
MLTLTSCLPARFAWYNFANITDHRIFPSRPLTPSSRPWHFDEASKYTAPKTITLKGKEFPFEQMLKDSKTVAFMIIRNDSIVYQNYLNGYKKTDIVASFSMAKSVTATLVGISLKEGILGNVDDPVTKYIPTLKPAGFDKVTLKHLLQMTSGLKYTESYISPFSDAAAQYYGRRLERHILKSKLKHAPGETFEYTSGTTQLLGYVLHKALASRQLTVTDYLQQKIWEPAGMVYSASWSIDKQESGLEKTFCCINAVAEDFARIGRLYLHKGYRDDVSIVPESWVAASTAVDTSEASAWFYQYQWWIGSKMEGDFLMNGHLGQYVYVHPGKNLIIVRLGKKEGGIPWQRLMQTLAEVY